MKSQQPAVLLLFTGLSGSGKSTIANALDRLLHAHGKHTYILDGDNVRHGLNRAWLQSTRSRREHPPRCRGRRADGGGELIEILVDTPLEECARRDPEGLYRKALAGKIANFTGVSSPYEIPEGAELHPETVGHDPAALAFEIEQFLERRIRMSVRVGRLDHWRLEAAAAVPGLLTTRRP
ncbi:adenylyl-sulfate kinase [Rhizobium sp. CIAT894]|uniref:adenylyl-sulfate kinase n=1 Tax=Rhizobium sp. CIAT894 TaxID=2020312 RepID=UPI001FDA1BF9|nr:adenylyl-sulfate kinase [Rhizobium sp. CIAT894]